MKKRFLLSAVFTVLFVSFTLHSEASTTTNTTKSNVENQVREYFLETPVMIEIARCESEFRQQNDSGTVLRGGAGGQMLGVFQFYESIHLANAKSLGYDINTLEGNLAYARHIYEKQGTTPWNSSKSCWENAVKPTSTSQSTSTDQTPQTPATISANTNNIEALQAKITLLLQLIELLKQLRELQNS